MADNARTVQVIIVETPTDKFDIPFDYLSKQFVKLFIDAVPQEPLVDFDFITATRIQMLTGNVPVGAVVELRRRTDSSSRLVTFKDASVLTASDLDISALQTLHMAEEAQDAALDAVSINQDGVYDARLKRIVNVEDPVDPQDAMNLRSANTLGASILGTASAKAQEAVQAANLAVTSKGQAEAAAGAAGTAAGTATAKAAEAVQAAGMANTAKTEVEADLVEYRTIRDELIDGPAGGMIPVGKPDWCPMRTAIWGGFGALDGQELPHATYPDFVAALIAGNLPLTTEALWQSDPTQRGKFVLDSSPGKFRLADYNGKSPGALGAVVRRGDGVKSSGDSGRIQRDQLGPMLFVDTDVPSPTSVYISNGTPGSKPVMPSMGAGSGNNIAPKPGAANGQPWITNTGDETRGLNVTGWWVIKLYGALVNVGSADAAQLASDFANLTAVVSALSNASIFTGEFSTPWLSFALGGELIIANPLNSPAWGWSAELQNQTGQAGYLPGAEIPCLLGADSYTNAGFQITKNLAAEIRVRCGSSYGVSVLNLGTGANERTTPINWKVRFKFWRKK